MCMLSESNKKINIKGKNKEKYQINLTQIHNNELPGKCELARTGHRSRIGGMNWKIINEAVWKELEEERKGMKLRLGR